MDMLGVAADEVRGCGAGRRTAVKGRFATPRSLVPRQRLQEKPVIYLAETMLATSCGLQFKYADDLSQR